MNSVILFQETIEITITSTLFNNINNTVCLLNLKKRIEFLSNSITAMCLCKLLFNNY